MFPGNWLQLLQGLDEAQAYSGPMGWGTVVLTMSMDDVADVQVIDEILRKGMYE